MVGDINIFGRFISKVWLFVALWLLVGFILTLVVPPNDLFEFASAATLCVGLGVVVAYFPRTMQILREGVRNGGDILTLGIWIGWVGMIMARAHALAFQWMSKPAWMLEWNMRTFPVSIILLAGVFHLAGPEAIQGRVPKREWLKIGAIVAGGALILVGAAWGFDAYGWTGD